jgi:hypothetical protein
MLRTAFENLTAAFNRSDSAKIIDLPSLNLRRAN